MLKSYLPEPRHKIRLQDLVNGERDKVLARLDAQEFQTDAFSKEIFVDQVRRYEAALDVLLPMSYQAGMWSELDQVRPWKDAIRLLAARERGKSGVTVLTDLTAYPACLVMYAFLLGAVVGARPASLGAMVCETAKFGHHGVFSFGDRLNAGALITDGGQTRFKMLPGLEQRKVAASDHIAELLRPICRVELPDDIGFDDACARVELVLAFGYAERIFGERSGELWCPPGRFCYQHTAMEIIIKQWREQYAADGVRSELSLMAGLSKEPRFDEVVRFARRFNAFAG